MNLNILVYTRDFHSVQLNTGAYERTPAQEKKYNWISVCLEGNSSIHCIIEYNFMQGVAV